MKGEYIDTAFGNLISSYAYLCDGLTDEEIEKALRVHVQRWGGCISCRYSLSHPDSRERRGNIWYQRKCQRGLNQQDCEMWTAFPEEEKNNPITAKNSFMRQSLPQQALRSC